MGRQPRTRPSFFKVLIADFSKRLKIPPGFVKHFKGKRPKKFILQSPNGKSWCVRMKKIKSSWFIQEGWERFVICHSLEVGDFLVFKFNGKAKFRVTVYDRSACEKELPLAKKRNCNHHEVKAICNIKKEEEEEEPKEAILNPNKAAAIIPRKITCGTIVLKKGSIKSQAVLEAVSSFKTESPHFIHILRQSRKYFMTVPRALASQNGLTSKGSIVLQVPHGIPHRVQINQKKDGRVNIARGWFDFQKANHLACGDACIFEFIRDMGNAICVHIFRARAPAPGTLYVDLSSCSAASSTETVKMLTYHDASDDETK
ncbi:hypothetical protein NE237_023789 [Protea cynaroides]|uniref:TF-B3 domain-containing protein n=1 Tax=Protea cynaroides TaxID=273540 RepID=A0A9Q0HFQ4_9MAGN|nr:hypothetical protein NE237_023789 [Protea cynaroides]